MKQITINKKEIEEENAEGIFLVNPTWIHLDEREVQEKLEKGEKLFKVNFEEIK